MKKLCDGCGVDVAGQSVAEIEGNAKDGAPMSATLCMRCALTFVDKSPAMKAFMETGDVPVKPKRKAKKVRK